MENNIKVTLKGTGCEDVAGSNVAQNGGQATGSYEYGYENPSFIRDRESTDQLSNC
jgi:hypothetical protein